MRHMRYGQMVDGRQGADPSIMLGVSNTKVKTGMIIAVFAADAAFLIGRRPLNGISEIFQRLCGSRPSGTELRTLLHRARRFRLQLEEKA